MSQILTIDNLQSFFHLLIISGSEILKVEVIAKMENLHEFWPIMESELVQYVTRSIFYILLLNSNT
jgi:hypothetical protein